jgi:hypothetical protein
MTNPQTDPSLQNLAAVLSPDVFHQFAPILTNIAERLSNSENTIGDLRREAATQESLISAFREALSGATLHTSSSSTPSGCASLFHIDLLYFCGTINKKFHT